jgi:hypothetical protein
MEKWKAKRRLLASKFWDLSLEETTQPCKMDTSPNIPRYFHDRRKDQDGNILSLPVTQNNLRKAFRGQSVLNVVKPFFTKESWQIYEIDGFCVTALLR